MKQALSRKNLWNALPRPVKASVGLALRAVPLSALFGARFRAQLRLARAAQRWTAEQSRAYQVERLRWICGLAYAQTAFYRRLFDEAGFDPRALQRPEDIRVLPTIDKHTVRGNLAEMCATSPNAADVDFVSTGGTGGVPLEFYINADRSAAEYAHLIASWERAGYTLGTPLAVFRGRIVPPGRGGLRHEYDPVLRHHTYSNFHMTDADVRRYLEHVGGIGPCFLHVYPSSAAVLAAFLRRTGTPAPANVRGLIAESEIVYPEQRRLIEGAFGVRLFSCYGHTEKLVLAAECEHCTDDHVWPSYGYCELLDEQGQPVTTPGTRGEIVGTGFINRVVPFIRYRTGDFATYVGERCDACGREQLVLRDIRGHRIQESLVLADGSQVSWTAMNMHDDTFANVQQFQFYQDTPGQAELRIVPAESFGEADSRRIRQRLDQKLNGRLTFTLVTVDAIRTTARGKAIYVDQQIRAAAPGTNGADSAAGEYAERPMHA